MIMINWCWAYISFFFWWDWSDLICSARSLWLMTLFDSLWTLIARLIHPSLLVLTPPSTHLEIYSRFCRFSYLPTRKPNTPDCWKSFLYDSMTLIWLLVRLVLKNGVNLDRLSPFFFLFLFFCLERETSWFERRWDWERSRWLSWEYS